MLDNDLETIKTIIRRDLDVIVYGDDKYLKLKKNRNSFIKTLDLSLKYLDSIEESKIKQLNNNYKIINSWLDII